MSTLTLPETDQRHPAVPEFRLPSLESLRILTVSPFREDHLAVHAAFDAMPCRLYEARSYTEALRVLCFDRMPVVICEASLPDGTWLDVLGQIVQLAECPRLIVASPLVQPCFRDQVIQLGAYGVLTKPLNADHMLDAVARAIGNHQ